MYATDFQFDGELASSYGLMICSFDNSNGIETIRNGADISLTTTRSPGSNVWNHVYGKYDEVLTTTFQIIKNTCDNDSNRYFDTIEQRAINRWLNRLDKFYPFQIVQDGFEDIYFNAQINVNKIEICGNVVGFELTVTTDKPYGYFKEQELNFSVSGGGSYSFVNISDDIGRIPAKIKVTCLTSGDLTIANDITNTTLSLKNCTNGEIIEVDTKKKKITSSMEGRNLAELFKDFNFKWFYISNTMETRKNTLTFSIPCNVQITYDPICKISF